MNEFVVGKHALLRFAVLITMVEMYSNQFKFVYFTSRITKNNWTRATLNLFQWTY